VSTLADEWKKQLDAVRGAVARWDVERLPGVERVDLFGDRFGGYQVIVSNGSYPDNEFIRAVQVLNNYWAKSHCHFPAQFATPPADIPCRQCERPNDPGIKSCWWCECPQPTDPTARAR
jgi:hypothetical protein